MQCNTAMPEKQAMKPHAELVAHAYLFIYLFIYLHGYWYVYAKLR